MWSAVIFGAHNFFKKKNELQTLKTWSHSTRSCHFTTSHSLSLGAALPWVFPHFLEGNLAWTEGNGSERHLLKTLPLCYQLFLTTPNGNMTLHRRSQLFFPCVRCTCTCTFGAAMPSATCLVIPAIGQHWQTPSLRIFRHGKKEHWKSSFSAVSQPRRRSKSPRWSAFALDQQGKLWRLFYLCS